MSYRIWLFLAGLSGLLSVVAAAHGAHALNPATLTPAVAKIYDTAQLFHMVHALALIIVAILMAATEEHRNAWAGWMLQIAAFGFLLGTVLFSGAIYYHVLAGTQPTAPIVPAGGVAFMIGWAALALSAFGYQSGTEA